MVQTRPPAPPVPPIRRPPWPPPPRSQAPQCYPVITDDLVEEITKSGKIIGARRTHLFARLRRWLRRLAT